MVLVATTVAQFGIDGLLLTVIASGVMLTLIGAFGLGSLIRHVPHPVTVGFSAGIAGTIFASQIHDLFGLTMAPAEPRLVVPKLARRGAAERELGRPRHRDRHIRADLRAATLAADIACDADRHRIGGPGGGGISSARRNHRRSLRRYPPGRADPPSSQFIDGTLRPNPSGRRLVHLAGRRRKPVVRQGRRRHDRTQASLQHGAGGARNREHRFRHVRRHQRDRNDRPDRHQHPRRRPQPISWSSCWSLLRLRATSRFRRLLAAWWSSAGPWSRKTNSSGCRRTGVAPWCCFRHLA
jgi:hypothetical protein